MTNLDPWDIPQDDVPLPIQEDFPSEQPSPFVRRNASTYEEQLAEQLIRQRATRTAKAQLDQEEADARQSQTVEYAGAANGLDFVFGQEAELEVIWGTPDKTAWAGGEAMMLFAPQGVGKTTIAQQLMHARIGLTDRVLGMPVKRSEKRVLYIAGDRPRQAARAMRRLFWNASPAERKVAEDKLVVWKGPLPHNLVERPTMLRELAEHYGCDTVFIDSIKDVIAKLNDDEAGSMYNRAIQMCLVAGVEVVDLHHPRKADSKDGSKPKSVDDVYGSTWLTAGHGSIISLWGKTGDLVVELSQLKMVNDEVGPFKVEHDHERGISYVMDQFDLLGALIRLGTMTATSAASLQCSTSTPNAAQKAKARRSLQSLVKAGQAVEHAGTRGGDGGGQETTWTPAAGAKANGGRTTSEVDELGVPQGGFGGGGRSVAKPDIF